MKWSIIIVTYNSAADIGRCLSRLPVADTEVIIVDNASTDSTPEFLKAVSARVILNETNSGFAAACNQGAAAASGDLLLFLNPDTALEANALSVLASAFTSDPSLGIAAPLILDHAGERETYSCGRFPTVSRLLRRSIAYEGSPTTVDWVSGAALAIPRALFESVGGFDEGFFMYYEDIDLCYRLRGLSKTVSVIPQAIVRHERGKSISDPARRKRYYYRSQDYYFRKHFPSAYAWLVRLFSWPVRSVRT